MPTFVYESMQLSRNSLLLKSNFNVMVIVNSANITCYYGVNSDSIISSGLMMRHFIFMVSKLCYVPWKNSSQLLFCLLISNYFLISSINLLLFFSQWLAGVMSYFIKFAFITNFPCYKFQINK